MSENTKSRIAHALRDLGLPEAWAEWCTEIRTEYVHRRRVTHISILGPDIECNLKLRDEYPWWSHGQPPDHSLTFGHSHQPRQSPPATEPDAAHWEAVAEKAHAELAELRGALAVAVRERDMATASERRMWSTMLSAQMERDGLRELVASLLRPTQSKPAAQLRELCLEMAANLAERAKAGFEVTDTLSMA
jgi:hypothetical protein